MLTHEHMWAIPMGGFVGEGGQIFQFDQNNKQDYMGQNIQDNIGKV